MQYATIYQYIAVEAFGLDSGLNKGSIFTPCARMRGRGRVFGLSVGLSVCPPLFGLFVRWGHLQGLNIRLTGRSVDKSSL